MDEVINGAMAVIEPYLMLVRRHIAKSCMTLRGVFVAFVTFL